MRKYAGFVTKEILLPISLVTALLGGFFWLGSLSAKVEEITVKDSPTRYEYNQLCSKLDRIESGIVDINNYLREVK